MTMFDIDDGAHDILTGVRDELKSGGISGASFSSAVRWLNDHQVEEGTN